MSTGRDETELGSAGAGQRDEPFYKKKAFLVPAGLYALLKVASKLGSVARSRRRKKVVKRIDRRQRAEQRRRRQRDYRRRHPLAPR